MNLNSFISSPLENATADMSAARILIIPYMWIGDFVRCHTVVKLLKQRCPALALAKGEPAPNQWPLPELKVPAAECVGWRRRLGLASEDRGVIALAPGAVGPAKRWPAAFYADLARRLAAEGHCIWVIGGPKEKEIAAEIAAAGDIRDLTGA